MFNYLFFFSLQVGAIVLYDGMGTKLGECLPQTPCRALWPGSALHWLIHVLTVHYVDVLGSKQV
jgi:hypothetical protein